MMFYFAKNMLTVSLVYIAYGLERRERRATITVGLDVAEITA